MSEFGEKYNIVTKFRTTSKIENDAFEWSIEHFTVHFKHGFVFMSPELISGNKSVGIWGLTVESVKPESHDDPEPACIKITVDSIRKFGRQNFTVSLINQDKDKKYTYSNEYINKISVGGIIDESMKLLPNDTLTILFEVCTLIEPVLISENGTEEIPWRMLNNISETSL